MQAPVIRGQHLTTRMARIAAPIGSAGIDYLFVSHLLRADQSQVQSHIMAWLHYSHDRFITLPAIFSNPRHSYPFADTRERSPALSQWLASFRGRSAPWQFHGSRK